MRAWRPKSWSAQARKMGDRMIGYVNDGVWCIEQVEHFFHISYRHPRIVMRAAKRFGRAVRAGKVHQSYVALEEWGRRKEQYGDQLE